MKVLNLQEVNKKQAVAAIVSVLIVLTALITLIVTLFGDRSEAVQAKAFTPVTVTYEPDMFDRPPHHVIISTTTVKPVHKIVPKPKPTPKKKHTSVVHKKYTGGGGWAASASVWKNYPAWVEQDALCIVHHESWSAGLWRAYNPSGAGGAYQFMPPTWRTWLKRAGLHGPSNAQNASAVLQSQVFAYTVTHGGQGNWGPDHCR